MKLGKNIIKATLCVAMSIALYIALAENTCISAQANADSIPIDSQNEVITNKPIIHDKMITTDIVSYISNDIVSQDAVSKHFDVSNESWKGDIEYVSNMLNKIINQHDNGEYAIAIDTSKCRVGIFKQSDTDGIEYALDKAFYADLGYIDNITSNTHTFTGVWHIDHRTTDGPEGSSFFTCFITCWDEDGSDDGQGFHSGYDGTPSYESAGCTRLFYNDAKYIFDNVPNGTLVLVY